MGGGSGKRRMAFVDYDSIPAATSAMRRPGNRAGVDNNDSDYAWHSFGTHVKCFIAKLRILSRLLPIHPP